MKLLCLGFEGKVRCHEPATLVCFYDAGPLDYQHFRCDAHRPPEGWFVAVARLRHPPRAPRDTPGSEQLELPGL